MSSFQTEAPATHENSGDTSPRSRTAVLVVQGMAAQRPLAAVKGIVNAVWLDSNSGQKRIWTHFEAGGTDGDITVFTTNSLPDAADHRRVDFLEFYWTPLLSESRSAAVLLWLIELVRKGPLVKPGIKIVWWVVAIFLAAFIFSITFIAIKSIKLADSAPTDLVPMILFALAILGFAVVSLSIAYRRYLAVRLGLMLLVTSILLFVLLNGTSAVLEQKTTASLANIFVPVVLALVPTMMLMGLWGARALVLFWLLSMVTFITYLAMASLFTGDTSSILERFVSGIAPWSFASDGSVLVAWLIVGFYLASVAGFFRSYLGDDSAVGAPFLQIYLGDVASYFRNSTAQRKIRKQAVETLDALHASGNYDRIIVVAHSLGTVIAYDMLRAYFGRICKSLPDPAVLGPEVDDIDAKIIKPEESPAEKCILRNSAREIIRKIAAVRETGPELVGTPSKVTKWLVTDFVTLGSTLTHAYHLMCSGNSYEGLEVDFQRRVNGLEFPTCPPARRDDDGLLLFKNPATKKREFHHGAVFGLTRWTNLYFPPQQLLWGDAIGGPLNPLFGSHIEDVKVYTYTPGHSAFFTHTSYWSIAYPDGRNAPHIQALRTAINLEDRPA